MPCPTCLLSEGLGPTASGHWWSDWPGPRRGPRVKAHSPRSPARPRPHRARPVRFARSLLSLCSQVVLCSYDDFVRFRGFLHGSLFCVSESMLYLDGKRHFSSMSVPVNLRKD